MNRYALCVLASVLMAGIFAICGACRSQQKYKVSKPVNLVSVHDTIIKGLDITGEYADCIKLSNCYNVTIEHCSLRSSSKNGITVLNCRNVKIINCYFEGLASGVYALQSQAIAVTQNQFKNMKGPFPRGQFVQFDEVTGEENRISDNTGENLPGLSDPQDAINVFKSSGTVNDPIKVTGNRIRGGGPSKEGGGIMLGDNGGAYITAENNILVNPGQYGMAIAGGTNISVINNVIYARKQPFTNVGIYIWNQQAPGCAMNTIKNNRVNWTNAAGKPNPGWNNGNCGLVTGWDTNDWNAKIDAAILPVKLIDVN